MNKVSKNAYDFKLDFLKLWLEAEMQEVFDSVTISSRDKYIVIHANIDNMFIKIQEIFSKSYEELSNSDLADLKYKFWFYRNNYEDVLCRRQQSTLTNFSKVLKCDEFQDALKTFRDNRENLKLSESELVEYSLKYSEDPSEQNEKDLVWRTSERDLSKRLYGKSLENLFKTLMENFKK